MPFVSSLTPELTNKKTGDLIKATDWNTLATEVANLSNSMLGREGGGVEGDLHVQGALAVVGATTVDGPARLNADLSVDGNGDIGGSLHVQRELTVGEAVRAPVFISTSRMIHRMYPASPLIYEDIFEALNQGVIAKLGDPTVNSDWNTRQTAANPWRGRPMLQLGSKNDSDGSGAVVTVPKGYNTLWLRLHGGGASLGLKAYFLDGAGEAVGHWSGGQRPYQVCPDGSLPDNAGAQEGYDHQWLAIPVGRSGKVALISQQSEAMVWYSGVAFSRNPWAHTGQAARGYALGFNGSRGVTWHSAQYFGDQAGSIAPSQAGVYSFRAQWGSKGSGNGQLGMALHVAVDSSGNVYVADWGNNRIQKFDSNGGYLTQWGSKEKGGPGKFFNPCGVAVDSNDNVYVADNGQCTTQGGYMGTIQKFTDNGAFLRLWTTENQWRTAYDPVAIAFDPTNRDHFYSLDNIGNRISKHLYDGQLEYTFVISTNLNQRPTAEDRARQAQNPMGLAVDSRGNIYFTDSNNHRIQKFASAQADYARLPMWGKLGSGNGEFNNPFGIAIDRYDNIYVTDVNNHRVQVFDSNGNYLTQWGTKGSGPGQFNAPKGIAVDNDGNVYVVDSGNHRIQKFAQSAPILQVPVIPNGRDKLLYLVNAPQLKDESSYDNGLQLTGIRVNGQSVERFLATYDNPFARYWNSRPGCNYNAALIPAELIPADARFLSVEIDLSRQFDDIKFREVGTHDLDVPLAG
ncbi:6-bladed beta-propeller [bacterium]|nr:6-bladed beta-propeller [bacterium]